MMDGRAEVERCHSAGMDNEKTVPVIFSLWQFELFGMAKGIARNERYPRIPSDGKRFMGWLRSCCLLRV
jgi:hypothetical protein